VTPAPPAAVTVTLEVFVIGALIAPETPKGAEIVTLEVFVIGAVKVFMFPCVAAAARDMAVVPEPVLSPVTLIVWFAVSAPRLAAVITPWAVMLE
jgi:hypothetical protein